MNPGAARDIERCLDEDNDWSVLAAYTTPKDLADVRSMCRAVNPDRWEEIYVRFWGGVAAARRARPNALVARDEALPADWFHAPFYYLYVQYFGTAEGQTRATFDDLARQLDYLEQLGTKNLYLLPHYQSPMADGGYDVSAYEPRTSLGGRLAFWRFMARANERGFRVITDAPFNHTSIEHPWFEALKRGDPEKASYYLRVDGRKKVGESDVGGDIVAHYVDPDGTRTDQVCIFPDVDRTHFIEVESAGRRVQVHRGFYPFQVDLDLTNPLVLGELFELLGREANFGVLGKRTDAIAHWIKRAGTKSDGLPETHALHALLRSYFAHVAPKSIFMPEAVRGAAETATYAGVETAIAGQRRASEGDALLAFEMQGALREMLYLQTSTPFWTKVFTLPSLPAATTWLNLLDHHDETYMGFISPENRERLGHHIEERGGRVYKNRMSAGGRYADCLDHDARRIALSLFVLYMAPGTPAIYYGAEIGQRNQPEHAGLMQHRQHQILARLGAHVELERTYDPRELQRGPIDARQLEEASSSGYLGFEMVRRLNGLRRSHAALRSNLLTPVANGHDDVLSLVKFTRADPGPPLLAIANLSGASRAIEIPTAELRTKLDAPDGALTLTDRLDDDSEPVVPGDAALQMTLPAYACLLLART